MSDLFALQEAKRKILSADLSSVTKRLILTENWRKAATAEVISQYRNFLYLKKKYGNQYVLPPSMEIDEAWHAHILHTEEYTDFCNDIFGYYLHHRPHRAQEASSIYELGKLFEQTQKLYKQEFGDYIRSVKTSSPFIYIKNAFNKKFRDDTLF